MKSLVVGVGPAVKAGTVGRLRRMLMVFPVDWQPIFKPRDEWHLHTNGYGVVFVIVYFVAVPS